MGIGHQKQLSLISLPANHLSHGGTLPQKRSGRQQRPLSSKEPVHLVFKENIL